MSDERIALMLDVLGRSDSPIDRATLEDDLYQALKDDLPPNAHRAIVDVLALFQQAESIASRKGTKRGKGAEVLNLLNFTNAKWRHVKARNEILCRVIASEMHRRDNQKLTSALRDEMANLVATDPSEISKIWRAGRKSTLAIVGKELPKKLVEDEKTALAKLSEKLGNTRGN
ncbi:MAG: hypothetical protein P8M73_06050 [Luminiphilus sp.]|nr:hypothetical protein [Luminiphilus sp.]